MQHKNTFFLLIFAVLSLLKSPPVITPHRWLELLVVAVPLVLPWLWIPRVAESLKAVATAATGRGTFWTSAEHFGPKFTLFCRICAFVANHAP